MESIKEFILLMFSLILWNFSQAYGEHQRIYSFDVRFLYRYSELCFMNAQTANNKNGKNGNTESKNVHE